MLKNPRKAMGKGELRFLKKPLPVQVEVDKYQEPSNVLASGYWQSIEGILDRWHLEDEWWNPAPIDRVYYECVLNTGNHIVLYRDRISREWYKQ